MATPPPAGVVGFLPHRRRASDRARERAGRAAYFGDRAGLLIATSWAVALTSSRVEANEAVGRRLQEPTEG